MEKMGLTSSVWKWGASNHVVKVVFLERLDPAWGVTARIKRVFSMAVQCGGAPQGTNKRSDYAVVYCKVGKYFSKFTNVLPVPHALRFC